MFCTNCGNSVPDTARFCTNCGAPVQLQASSPEAPSPAPAPVPAAEPVAAAATPAATTATSEAPAAQPSPPLVSSSPVTAPAPPRTAARSGGPNIGDAFKKLQPLEFGILGGLVVAAVSTFLPWAGVSAFGFSETASAWNGDLGEGLRFADWLSAGFPLDALLVVLLALAGVYVVLGPQLGWPPVKVPYATMGIGVALAVIGVLNYLHIENETDRAFDETGIGEGLGVSAGTEFGVYLLILAGIAVAACSFMIEQNKKKAAAA